jgi:hypothetical protein
VARLEAGGRAALRDFLDATGEDGAHPPTTADARALGDAVRVAAEAGSHEELAAAALRALANYDRTKGKWKSGRSARGESRCRLDEFPAGRGLLQFGADAQAACWGVLVAAAEAVRAAHVRGKHARLELSYDDLLNNLRDALRDGERAETLRTLLREEYRAALLDEFQDTDPVQYAIFRDIFDHPGNPPWFLVGDPKQAIYGFRSGDIHTYLSATRAIRPEAVHDLDRNFRSEARLVDAVNQIFADRAEDGGRTFRHPEIEYDGTLLAAGKSRADSLTVDGRRDEQPFKLWFYRGGPKRVAGLESAFTGRVFADTAAEIRRLLDDERTLIAGRRIRPDQIAVLVLRHAEADLAAQALAAVGVPAVRQAVDHVFDADEAADLAILLHAMAEPRNPGRVCWACRTAILRRSTPGCAGRRPARIAPGMPRRRPRSWPWRTGSTCSKKRPRSGGAADSWPPSIASPAPPDCGRAWPDCRAESAC